MDEYTISFSIYVDALGEIWESESVALKTISKIKDIKTEYDDLDVSGKKTLLNRLKRDIVSLIFEDHVSDIETEESEEFVLEIIDDIYGKLTEKLPWLALDFGPTNDDSFAYILDVKGTSIADILDGLFGSDIFVEDIPFKNKPRGRRKTQQKKAPVKKPKKFGRYDLSALSETIKENILGQDEAVDSVLKAVKLHMTGLEKNISFLFCGPTGTGKTTLATALGDLYAGRVFKLNCAEYSKDHEYAKLIGSPAGYVGSDKPGILEDKAQESNRWVFIFDEIEKASDKLQNILLALLDTGTVDSNRGQRLDFTESIFIFTSNLGYKHEEKEFSLGFDSKEIDKKPSKESVVAAVKNWFTPEFVNRIDDIICFDYLSDDIVKGIIKLELSKLPIKQNKRLVEYIYKKGYDILYGARHIQRTITKEVKVPLADMLLKYDEIYTSKMKKKYTASVKDNTLTINRIKNA